MDTALGCLCMAGLLVLVAVWWFGLGSMPGPDKDLQRMMGADLSDGEFDGRWRP